MDGHDGARAAEPDAGGFGNGGLDPPVSAVQIMRDVVRPVDWREQGAMERYPLSRTAPNGDQREG